LLEFAPIAKLAESGLGTISEIESSWTFDMIRKGLAYIDMKNSIEKAVQKILAPKGKD